MHRKWVPRKAGFIIYKERKWISNIKIFDFLYFLKTLQAFSAIHNQGHLFRYSFDDTQRIISFSYNVQRTKLFLSLVCIQHLNWADYSYRSSFSTNPQQQRRGRQENLYTLMYRVKDYLFKICVDLCQSLLYLSPLEKELLPHTHEHTHTGLIEWVPAIICVSLPVNQASISGYLAGWLGVRCCRCGWEMTALRVLLNIHHFYPLVYCCACACLCVCVPHHTLEDTRQQTCTCLKHTCACVTVFESH